MDNLAAELFADSSRALIYAMGMQAENEQRKIKGEAMAYVESDFVELVSSCNIDHNQVIERSRR